MKKLNSVQINQQTATCGFLFERIWLDLEKEMVESFEIYNC